MLTKDLLKFKKQKGKITPSFIDTNDKDLLELANDLIKVFETSVSLSFTEINEKLEDLKPHASDHHLAFEKLLCLFVLFGCFLRLDQLLFLRASESMRKNCFRRQPRLTRGFHTLSCQTPLGRS